ncbi:MAG: NAD(P)-dependent alcohol dehydrogenase [Terracidiphilus sp.]|nr:NAD(P)-dependent alcohol dehydrogenase [Terracidiphilus sp.]
MRAMVNTSYGSPDALRYEEIDKPTPGEGEVLVKIHAASVNPLDVAEMKGIPLVFRMIFGVHAPTAAEPAHPGVDLAGVVEAVGSGVKELKPGDTVFGLCRGSEKAGGAKAWVHRWGAYAEYACVGEMALARKPENISFEQAAALPIAAITALQGLRDVGQMKPGKQVLVHGAAGGVGTFAVQIAKVLGGEVTGVTSTENLELVHSLGADHVVDYTQTNFTTAGEHYDLILDCHAKHGLLSLRRALKRGGIYVGIGASKQAGVGSILGGLLGMLILSRLGSKKLRTFLAKPKKADLDTLAKLVADGKVTPVIDRCFSFNEIRDAMRYQQEGHPRGKVVISIA